MKNFVYLHGFNSAASPNSEKVKMLKTLGNVYTPTYDSFAAYDEILDNLQKDVSDIDSPIFVGTSLGAYWAMVLSESWYAPAVLINPLLRPVEWFWPRIGQDYVNYKTGRYQTVTVECARSYAGAGLLSFLDDSHFRPLILLDERDEVLNSAKTLESLGELDDDAYFMIHSFAGGNHRFAHMKQALNSIEEYTNLCELSV